MAETQGPFDSNFDNFVEVVNESIHGARTVEGEMIHTLDGRFLPTYPHRMSLQALQRVPRYLSDSILSSRLPVSILTWDHYSFWAWTAAISNALNPNSMVFHAIRDEGSEGPPDEEGPLSKFHDIMSEYNTMSHLILFPIRQSQLDNRVRAFVSSMNPNVDGVEDSTVLGFAGTNGFSVLDGLLRRHCEVLNTDEQIINKGRIDDSWRDDGSLQDRPNLRGKLWLWANTNPEISGFVRQTLREIDDLERDEYDVDHLDLRIEEFDKSEWDTLPAESSRRDSFFWILTEQRNQNVHGAVSTQLVGPLVLNLCTLCIWDSLSEENYEQIRQQLLQTELRPGWNQSSRMTRKLFETPIEMDRILPNSHGFGSPMSRPDPSAFYPIFSDEENDVRETDFHSIDDSGSE